MQNMEQQGVPCPSSSIARANPADERAQRILIEMFPDLDLTDFIQRFGQQMSIEELVAIIIQRRAEIPKKRKPNQQQEDDDMDSQADSDPCLSDSEELGDRLIDKLLATLIFKVKLELQRQPKNVGIAMDRNKRDFLTNQFLGVRMNFIDNMLIQFKNALFPASIACFLAQNNLANNLQKLLPTLSQNFWLKFGTPLQITRRRNNRQRVPAHVEAEFRRYSRMMRRYQAGPYAALLKNHFELVKHYRQIRWERTRTEPEQKVECLVCAEWVPMRRITYCTAPTTQHGPNNAFTGDEDKAGPSNAFTGDEDKAGPSNAFTPADEDVDNTGTSDRDDQHDELSMSDVSVSDEGINDPTIHPFCRDCIRGHAQAAIEQQPLAEGNVGLRCMMADCKNPILYTGIRSFLSRDICKKLDERIMQEELEMAHIPNLERCKRCNYAMEMEVDKTINKVFQCLQCDAKFCRICEEDWDDDHIGISCEEVEQKTKRSKKDRDLEKQLNEAVIRKCPRCGLMFMKDQGCNKMTCRCGMTSCYICRAERIDYTHFCQHVRDPNNRDGKCNECQKTCLLFEDPRKKDDQLIARIRREAGEKNNE